MKGYPTDEELELFIERMEQQELYAPRHMKEQILNQAFPKQTVEAPPGAGGGEKPVSFLAYRIKIIAGMAAAIAMLMIIPIRGEKQEYDVQIEKRFQTERMREEDDDIISFNNVFNEGTWRVNQKINLWFSRMNDWRIDNLFENGGIYYEN